MNYVVQIKLKQTTVLPINVLTLLPCYPIESVKTIIDITVYLKGMHSVRMLRKFPNIFYKKQGSISDLWWHFQRCTLVWWPWKKSEILETSNIRPLTAKSTFWSEIPIHFLKIDFYSKCHFKSSSRCKILIQGHSRYRWWSKLLWHLSLETVSCRIACDPLMIPFSWFLRRPFDLNWKSE